MRAGDPAVITLMTYPDQPLQGQVDSIGWGISQSDGSTGCCRSLYSANIS
jgi:multidrug resistance efflux pump